MGNSRKQRIHELDVTVWVGKNGLDPVVDELAERVGAEVVRTRGHTAVFER